MDRETEGGACTFDMTINDAPKWLEPISFILKRITATPPEKALHSSMGKAGTGVWTMKDTGSIYLSGNNSPGYATILD
jgi:hypothetical protein